MTDLQDPYGVDDEQTGSPMSGRGFILSAALIVLIVLVGIVVVTLNVVDDDEPSTDPAPSPSSGPTSSAPSDPEASVCGLTARKDAGGLVEAPAATEWTLVGKVALPSSTEHGPGVIEGRSRYCFARTPEGALLAAANTLGWRTVGDMKEALQHSVAAGEGRDAAQEVLDAVEDDSTDITGELLTQIRGFQIISYSASSAYVDLASQATAEGETGLVHQRFELVWEEGDWKVRFAPDGTAVRTDALQDLTGYVPWAGA